MKAPDPGKVLHLHTGSSAHFCHPAAVSEAWEHAYLHHPWAQTNSLHFCPVLSTHALSVPGSAPTCAAVVQLSSFPGRLPSRSLTLCTTTHSGRASHSLRSLLLQGRAPVSSVGGAGSLWKERRSVCSVAHAQRRGETLFPLPTGCEHIPSLPAQSP